MPYQMQVVYGSRAVVVEITGVLTAVMLRLSSIWPGIIQVHSVPSLRTSRVTFRPTLLSENGYARATLSLLHISSQCQIFDYIEEVERSCSLTEKLMTFEKPKHSKVVVPWYCYSRKYCMYVQRCAKVICKARRATSTRSNRSEDVRTVTPGSSALHVHVCG